MTDHDADVAAVLGETINETDEPVDAEAAVAYWRGRVADGAVFVVRLLEAIHDIDAHARPLGEDKDGFVTVGYAISIGSLHRALALAGTAPRCPECPHDDPHFEAVGLQALARKEATDD